MSKLSSREISKYTTTEGYHLEGSTHLPGLYVKMFEITILETGLSTFKGVSRHLEAGSYYSNSKDRFPNSDARNYRPITLTSILSKAMEKVVNRKCIRWKIINF